MKQNKNNSDKKEKVNLNQSKKFQFDNNNINSKIDLIGKKGKELWYPTYAPHILLGTDESILTKIYINHSSLR